MPTTAQPLIDTVFYKSNKKKCINTAIQFWVIGDLGVFAPYDFTVLSDQSQFADVDFHHGALGDDAQMREQSRLRVLLHSQNSQLKSSFKFRVRHVSLLEPQTRRPDKPLVFWRLSSEVVPHESHLVNLTLPSFFLN